MARIISQPALLDYTEIEILWAIKVTFYKKGQKLCMIECTKCYKTIPINPCNLLEIMDTQNKEGIVYCPICKDGIISHVKDETEDFFGCGECGNVWKNIEEINSKK